MDSEFVYIPFGIKGKIQSLAQFPVIHLSHIRLQYDLSLHL